MRKEGWAWERGGFGRWGRLGRLDAWDAWTLGTPGRLGRLEAGTIGGGDACMVRENGKRLQDSRIQ